MREQPLQDVCLICMPFAAIQRPSIGLGVLQALLEEAGISCRSLYPNLEWARRVDPDRYDFWEDVLGDLVFSEVAFPGALPDPRRHIAKRLSARIPRARLLGLPSDVRGLLAEAERLRGEAAGFVQDAARQALATGARVFGCTSMYWQQTASLAVLREIQRLRPDAITMLGGANCEGVMGQAVHRLFPWVDYVVSGEADDFFAPWVQGLLDHGRALRDLPEGVFAPHHRAEGYPTDAKGGVPRVACKNLERVPTPQYRDYFDTLAASGLGDVVRPGLMVETARGCWWGASHQCKFCGISEIGLQYHSKSPARVREELAELERRHGLSDFEVTDNILDMRYFKTLLPELAADPVRRRFFWEVKANLKREQVALMAKAGINWVQPGVESLDSRVLKLVDKGVQAGQNVLLLKWCREHGLRVAWNLLWGFPGEEDSWYAETARLVPHLVHLHPPRGLIRLRYDRYSVYQARPRDFGLRLRPASTMSLVYGLPEEDLEDLTYYFDLAEPAAPDAGPGVRALAKAMRDWHDRFWRPLAPVLAVDDDGEALHFLDSRVEAETRVVRLDGELRETYLRAEEGCARATAGPEDALQELVRQGLVLDLDGRVYGLGVRGHLPPNPTDADFPGGNVDYAALRRRRRPAPVPPGAALERVSAP